MGRCHRRALALALVVAALFGSAARGPDARAEARDAPDGPSATHCVLRTELEGVVTPGMADFLDASVREANARSCALLVVIDTPGGMLESTRDVVRAFLSSRAPVITFVGGEGARAASAGALIAMSGHVAAMAPSTHLGAAHPVALGGERSEGAIEAKVVNDAAAFARAIAERRGRNPEVAERMVRESIALTSREAVDEHVVDLEAPNERALLDALDGRTVQTADGPVTLDLGGAPVVTHPMALRDRVVHRLGDPSVAYVLLMAGMLALLFEITTPGVGVSGAIGALALFLAFLGLSRLPIDVGGAALILMGVGLLVAEVFVVSYGLLAAAGLGCLVLGAVLLVDLDNPDFWLAPDFSVPWALLAPTAIGVGAATLLLASRARRAARAPSPTGREALVGQRGRATRDVGPEGGEVGVLGERWTAFADEPIDAGTDVKVVEVQGLWLKVRPANAPGA